MGAIEKTFSDSEDNHLLVALCFCDEEYKRTSLNIPEEYADIKIIDIDITKAYVDRPIHYSVFFKMSTWLWEQFNEQQDAVFTFICSIDDLDTNHNDILPQDYRWTLFDKLFHRKENEYDVSIQDVIVGPPGYQSFGRAFYRDKHAPVIHIIASYLNEKQRQFN